MKPKRTPPPGTFAALYEFEMSRKLKTVPAQPDATPLHTQTEPATHPSNPRVAGVRTPQTARSKVQVNCRVNAEIARRVRVFCAEQGMELHEFWEAAATRMFEAPATPKTPHDDLMNAFDDIARAYTRFTGNPWNKRDARDARPYAGIDPKILDIAMVLTIERKLRGNTARQPIKSFAYFTGEIDTLLGQKATGQLPGGLDEYHRYVMAHWEKVRRVRDEKWKRN